MWKLRKLLQLWNSNKQWVFSGIGVAVVFAITRCVFQPDVKSTGDKGPVRGGKDQLFGQRLQGPSEINAAVESMAANGSKRIQLLIQVLGEIPHLPESLADTIARRISETNRLGVPIKYDPILVLDSENPPPGFLKAALTRGDVFSQYGVSQFVRPRYLDQKYNLGSDILIVDKKHVLIALNTVPGANSKCRLGSYSKINQK